MAEDTESATLLSPADTDGDEPGHNYWCCLWPKKDQAVLSTECCHLNDRFRAYKNMIGLCASYILALGSFLGMISLESSINPESGLGLVAAATPYLILIATGFLAPAALKLLGSKISIIVGYIGFLVFTLANYYPHWITLIIGSIITGLLYNIGVVALYDHASTVARTYFKSLKETQENAVYLYTSCIALSVKFSIIFGNLSSSIVLLTSATTGHDIEESNKIICNNTEAGQLKDSNITIYYILVTVYVLFNVLAIVTIILLLDYFSVSNDIKITLSCKEYLIAPMCETIESLLNWRMLLLVPLFVLEGMLIGFINGLFTKEYISDCIGISWIGFVLVAAGIGGIIGALSAGRLVKYIPQYVFMYCALLVAVGLILFLLIWERQPSYIAVFMFALGWGYSEGTLNGLLPGIISVSFEKRAAGFALFQMGCSAGTCMSYATAIIISSITQLWIILGVVVLGAITYTVFVLSPCIIKKQLAPCCARDTNECGSKLN